MEQTVQRICYFGVRNADYPRNKMISSYLVSHANAEIVKADIDTTEGFLKNLRDLVRFVYRTKKRYDTVVLAEFSLQFAILGFILSRLSGAVFVVDFFVGLYETRVEDCHHVSKRSLRARLFYSADLIAARLADVLLADNEVRAASIQKKYGLSSIPIVVHVGAPVWAVCGEPRSPDVRDRRLRVLYYGNYIPLHGIDKFVEAMISAQSEIDLAVTLIGDGEMRPTVESIVSLSDVSEIFTFVPGVDETELRDYIIEHDVVAGVFGDSPKAKNVIANKVWQGVACGAVVLTQRTAALDKIRESFPGILWETESDIGSIRDSIIQISHTEALPYGDRDAAAEKVKTIVRQGLKCMLDAISVRQKHKNWLSK